jgi:hypothetical protein
VSLPTDGQLSTTAISASFRAPRDTKRIYGEDWALGGVAFNDPTQGYEIYEWRCLVNPSTNQAFVGVPGVIADTLFYTLPEAFREVAFSFDTNMQPIIGWVGASLACVFRWYDPTLPGYTNVTLPAGSFSIRIDLDDHRIGQNSIIDTVVTYMRAGTLYYRLLRDRFTVEYTLRTGLAAYEIGQFGMNKKLRLQWQMVQLPQT